MSKPVARHGLLMVDGARSGGAYPIRIGSPAWYAWLTRADGFVFEGEAGRLTARRELRRGIDYWYAYRRSRGKLAKTYLGRSEALNLERLEQACARLAGLPGEVCPADLPTTLSGAQARLRSIPPDDTWSSHSFLPLTKIKPPALPQRLVARPRLTQQMRTPVSFIYAPSGFGKSTLLNEWGQHCDMPVAWVSLDAGDDHPAGFWFTVMTALQTVHSSLGQSLLPHLHTVSPAALADVVMSLANEIIHLADSARRFQRIGLILDDYHSIRHPEVHASLQTLLDHLPPPLRLVISSRTKPPLAADCLRARGMLTELKADDLRFTLEEGIDLLSRHCTEGSLAFFSKQQLVRRTEGWAAGLTLAGLALAQQGDPGQFAQSFTGAHSFLSEYFAESVLGQQPPSIRAFLLRTSILRNLTESLCDAVTGQANSAEMLAQLCQDNLFLVQSEVRGWYHYHDLFAEALRSQLQLQLPDEVSRLHLRAAEWYQGQDAPADAVYHLLAIEAWDLAASLIERAALCELEQFGEDSRLLRWLLQLPEAVVQRNRTLLSVYVRLAQIAMPRAEVEQFVARVEAGIVGKPADEQVDDERGVLAEIRQMRQQWAADDPPIVPSQPCEHQDEWQLLNGIARYQRRCARDAAGGEALAREVYEAAQARSNLFVMLIAGGGSARIALARGHLRQAEKYAYQALNQAIARRGKLPGPASIALATLSQVCYERNQLAQAHQFLVRACEVDPSPTSTNMPIRAALLRGLIQLAQGDGAAAWATLRAARDLHARRPSGVLQDEELLAYQALCALRQGDHTTAERLLSEAGDAALQPLSVFARADLLLQQGRATEAEPLLAGLIVQSPCGLHDLHPMRVRILWAVALFEQHKVNQARKVMTDAIRIAGPESHMRPFLDYGARCLPLLALVLSTEKLAAATQSFGKEILVMLRSTPGAQRAVPSDELMALSAAASITERERQVLRLLGVGSSNREIAARLCISESTVKTHLKNIFCKLEVDSRMRAVTRAQALKLM